MHSGKWIRQVLLSCISIIFHCILNTYECSVMSIPELPFIYALYDSVA